MIKPEMPNFSGMGAMTDTLDFVKNLWGSMGIPGMNVPGANAPGMSIPGMNIPGIPGMVMPTLSVEEINKKIADLKAVETWLTLNMNMLRGTIQALEVQAATISTLQTMGETFAATMQAGAAAAKPSAKASNGNGSSASSTSSATSEASAGDKRKGVPEPTSKDESDAANLTAPLVNAAAWWNMLQDQFKQAVNTAMTETPKSDEQAGGKPKAAAKSAGKDKDKGEPAAKASPSARKSKPEK
ncbi:PhaM family polyhydroxyalkanoate granule multifunctional regulatory protein [Noviherbaspirillum saxi]|uniref:PhaM family polyhydroxyalkanoate granule multifunctional regulatory protein n=1 Tax=Noviherbaspirillum saxi TaxID=2320863 RepID=UPI0018F2C593|nr:PhaM family polyhydroxyalkanoate granule multifunctional regulatory protein [Noviherbaspirillum saxi]